MRYAAISVITILWLAVLYVIYREGRCASDALPVYPLLFWFVVLIGIVPIGSIWAYLILERKRA